MKKILIFIGLVFVTLACNDFENTASFPEFVQWTNAQTSIDEDATEPIEVEVQLVGGHQSGALDITFDIEESNVTEGVNYTFPNGKTLTIAANASTATILIAVIDNDLIAPGEQSITLTLTGAGNLSIGDDTSPNKSVKVIINEDDFYCPRNELSKTVTKEEDLGYDTLPVSITPVTTPEGCYSFIIVGGFGTNLGRSDVFYGPINLVEDSPESRTGTIADATLTIYWEDGSEVVGSDGVLTIQITNGVYDLDAGTFQYDYEHYRGDVFYWPGTFLYHN